MASTAILVGMLKSHSEGHYESLVVFRFQSKQNSLVETFSKIATHCYSDPIHSIMEWSHSSQDSWNLTL